MAIEFGKHSLRVACFGLLGIAIGAGATEPCGDLGECKTLVEINSSDGDIGFHFLVDSDDVSRYWLFNPDDVSIFHARAIKELREQTITELFVESAEPLCFDPATDDDPENDDEDFTTLEEFLERWTPGDYTFIALDADGENPEGQTVLGFDLPAAPTDLAFDGSMISWSAGDDLGRCASNDELEALVADGVLPVHPEDVPVAAWEVVLEPEVDDGDPVSDEILTIRLSGETQVLAVTVPLEYLISLPDDTPAKVEILAIGEEDNATATEAGGFCLNEVEGCEDEEDEEDEDEDEDEDDEDDDDEDDDDEDDDDEDDD